MPLAIEQLDVSAYDLVISSSYLAAKGVLTRPDQLHLCYCHSPIRFAWDLQNQYLMEVGLTRGLRSCLVRVLLHYIRSWDVRSANGVDAFMSNSNFVSRRINKVYRRPSTAIYPPVDVEKFRVGRQKQDYYLTASRMVPYKRIDLIVDAFTQMPDRRLIVIGEGPEFAKIKSRAGSNVTLLGYQPAEVLRSHMQKARAFVFAAEEDFGIVPVEAQACGTPVIAYGRGGVTETVIDGVSGLFFAEQTPESLIDAVERFESDYEWDPAAIRKSAERFSIGRFRAHFASFIEGHWEAFCAKRLEGAVEADHAQRLFDAAPLTPRPSRMRPAASDPEPIVMRVVSDAI
jgi:glycosyltransferase involved in cell wall biosynthesis